MVRTGFFLCLAFLLIAPINLFGADEGRDEKALGEYFEKKIRPLFAKHCYECHSAATAEDNGHLAVDGRAGLMAGGSRGPLLTPGKPDESLLITAVRYSDPKLQMPPEGKMSAEEIDLLVQWIQSGGFVPEYGEAAHKKKEIDWTAARQFWSFRPLQHVTVPNHESTQEASQPIDSFILDTLAKQELKPSEQADKRTLIRRLYFDLLGLPPSKDDVAEFIADDRPDAYERCVDRLLASPHFGERWARYWLDLARYTDMTPTWLKNADQAWLYRDWIIRSINEDLPYDQFVKKQLAADLLDGFQPEEYPALGFIGLSPTYWKELRLAPDVIEVIVADEWDERIDAVSRTFLGLTVACARCHDHKFDPITSRDYYAIAGIFASTQLAERPLLPSPMAEQIADARQRVEKLEEALKAITDKESEAAKKTKAEIEEIRKSTPQFDAQMAHTVEEASIHVLPDGPEMTKLDVRRNQPRDLPVYRRGNPANPGEIVPRRFVEVLSTSTPQPYTSGSGRRELADSLFGDGRGLTSRVMVNRLWSHHFGRGLVRTTSDFGAQGDRPTHPELLEWLAASFAGVDSDQPWSMKRLHRQMVTSATYRQSSDTRMGTDLHNPGYRSFQVDPDNQWLARMSRRRLDVEPWRDTMLVAAGNLDSKVGGPATELDVPTNFRRTLYGRIGRDEQNDMLRLYDFPPPTSHSPSRDATTTPLQQLFILNSDFVEKQAAVLAARLNSEHPDATTGEKIAFCYESLFQRKPTDVELRAGEQFLAAPGNADPTTANRWPFYVQSLLGLNELLFID